MSALSVSPPFPIFTDVDGNPLEDGYIFIGAVNQNPEVVPISVFWDAALTIPAAQPIRTLGGYPSRSGTPARMYVDADDFSISIKNKNSTLIYSSLSDTTRIPFSLITGSASSLLIEFTAAGVSAIPRTAQAKMREVVTPEDHGAIGDGVADDKQAIIDAMTEAASTNADFVARGNYAVSGSCLVTGLVGLFVDLRGATFTQKLAFQKTFAFVSCTRVDVCGGRFVGLGAAGGEFNGASTSYNGVAAVHFEDCIDVSACFINAFNHAGGGIIAHDTTRFRAHFNQVVGIGSPAIQPGDNGSDFAIGCWSDDIAVFGETGLIADISHNDVSETAFGIFGNRYRLFLAEGNSIHDIRGQHGIYTIESMGSNISGNTIKNCNNNACKMNLENYVGNGLAPAGDINLYGYVYSSNVISDCGDGLVIQSTSLADNTEQALYGFSATGNVATNITQDGMVLMRCVGDVRDNRLSSVTRHGFQIRNAWLEIYNNVVVGAGGNGILATFWQDSKLKGNKLLDCGLSGSFGVNGQFPMYLDLTTAGFPSQPATARVDFDDNDIRFTTGDALSAQLVFIANRYNMSVTGTKTNSLKNFRVDGTLLKAQLNEFVAFNSGAQNSPATFLPGIPGRQFYGQQNPQAAASTDPFFVGDRTVRVPPVVGQPKAWVCTVSGSPGTWVSEGNL